MDSTNEHADEAQALTQFYMDRYVEKTDELKAQKLVFEVLDNDLNRKCLATYGCMENLRSCSRVYSGLPVAEQCVEDFNNDVNTA